MGIPWKMTLLFKDGLHPIVVYYKESSTLAEKSFCFISDDLEHNMNLVLRCNAN